MSDNKYIILADDDSDDRELFEEALSEINNNIKVLLSIDGAQLMDTLNETNSLKPILIFLDINMPKKNGFECLEQIRLSPTLKNIPVIIYSTCSQKDTVNKAFKSGANYFVRKPDNFGALKILLQKILNINFELARDKITRDTFVITI
ncbi:MAG TPA: response regulator [Bacteroidia bacterium]|nr:response regulator [Bacteroidia bacterium]